MLELKHISKTYKTSKGVETKALVDVNLKFPKKGMVFVLGKSGSGKSTLLNIVGGLDQANEGEIIINQKSSKDFSQSDYDSYRNTYVGFIFQEFNLMDDYTIEKNIALALQLQQIEGNHEVIETLLDKLGLAGYAGRYPNELSGGQKQRVAIARALVKNPEILMADEPTGALDSTTGKEIFDTLKELSKEKLVIVVSHDRDSAQLYADRIIEFKDGVIASDSNPEVEMELGEFHAIRSHLPFKDSFKLGFSCLGHKKTRMIFTILLTSFALGTLGISDAVGNFNSANAQNKAMEDLGENLVGIQRQLVDEEGNAIYSYYRESMNNISNAKAAEIMNATNKKFAYVYDSATSSINASSLGVEISNYSSYNLPLEKLYLAEMNDFSDLGWDDTIGNYPSNFEEVAISSYLADVILESGVKTKNGKMTYPKSIDDIVGKIQLKVENTWLTVSGIAKQDLSKYDVLKTKNREQLDEETRNLYSQFSNIINMDCNKLFVKSGFVESLKLEKGNTFMANNSSIMLKKSDTDMYNLQQLSYSKAEITYFNGVEQVTVKELKDDELILDLGTINQLAVTNGPGIYADDYENKSMEDKKAYVMNNISKMVGQTYQLQYQLSYGFGEKLIDQNMKIVGTMLPEDDDYSVNSITSSMESYCTKSLIEPLILEPLYLGELLSSVQGSERLELLENYSIDDEYTSHTFVSNEVRQIQSFADFATQVFLYASVAFFIFAAILMMNFIVVSIAYRKKDIGILRAIGARSSDVLKIFIWEGVTLALISYVLTIIGLQGVAYVVNNFAQNTIGISISPIIVTIRQPLVLLITVALVTAIACFIPVLKIARQKPIDAIKK